MTGQEPRDLVLNALRDLLARDDDWPDGSCVDRTTDERDKDSGAGRCGSDSGTGSLPDGERKAVNRIRERLRECLL